MATCRIHQIHLVSRERVCIQNRLNVPEQRNARLRNKTALNHSSYKHELVSFVAICFSIGYLPLCRVAEFPTWANASCEACIVYVRTYVYTSKCIDSHTDTHPSIRSSIYIFISYTRVSQQQLVYSTFIACLLVVSAAIAATYIALLLCQANQCCSGVEVYSFYYFILSLRLLLVLPDFISSKIYFQLSTPNGVVDLFFRSENTIKIALHNFVI